MGIFFTSRFKGSQGFLCGPVVLSAGRFYVYEDRGVCLRLYYTELWRNGNKKNAHSCSVREPKFVLRNYPGDTEIIPILENIREHRILNKRLLNVLVSRFKTLHDSWSTSFGRRFMAMCYHHLNPNLHLNINLTDVNAYDVKGRQYTFSGTHYLNFQPVVIDSLHVPVEIGEHGSCMFTLSGEHNNLAYVVYVPEGNRTSTKILPSGRYYYVPSCKSFFRTERLTAIAIEHEGSLSDSWNFTPVQYINWFP